MARPAARRRLAAVWLAAVVGTAALTAAGSGPLGTPPLLRPGQLGAWLSTVGPVDAGFAGVRLAGMAAGASLALAAGAGLVCRRGLPLRIVLRLSPRGLRALVAGAATVTVATGAATAVVAAAGATAVVAAAGAGASPPVVPAPTLVQLPAAPAPPAVPPAGAGAPPPDVRAPTLVQLPAGRAGGGAAPARRPAVLRPRHRTTRAAPGKAAGEGPVRQRSLPAGTWIVAPGDSFWSIAAARVAAVTGERPDRAAVGRYWAGLVEANRASLPRRGDPDLLYAGDAVVLPAVTAGGRGWGTAQPPR